MTYRTHLRMAIAVILVIATASERACGSDIAAEISALGGNVYYGRQGSEIEEVHVPVSKDAANVFSSLATIATLKSISVDGNGFSDRDALALSKNKSLTTVLLVDTRLTDFGLIALLSLPNLEMLQVQRGSITLEPLGCIDKLKFGSRLKVLDLSHCKITDCGAANIPLWPNLEQLYVFGNEAIGDEGVRCLITLNKLRTLDLSDTKTGSSGIEAISSLPSLKTLRLIDSKVDEEFVRRIRTQRPELKITD